MRLIVFNWYRRLSQYLKFNIVKRVPILVFKYNIGMNAIVARFGRSRLNSVQRSGKGNIAQEIFTPLIARANSRAAQIPILGLPWRCALQAAMSIIIKGKEINFLPGGRSDFKFYNFTAVRSGFPLIVASHIETTANAELFSGNERAVAMLTGEAGLYQPVFNIDRKIAAIAQQIPILFGISARRLIMCLGIMSAEVGIAHPLHIIAGVGV